MLTTQTCVKTRQERIIAPVHVPTGADDLHNLLEGAIKTVEDDTETAVRLSRLGLERRHVKRLTEMLADHRHGLWRLELSCCGIDTEDALDIVTAQSGPESPLKFLDLSHNRIKGGAMLIADMLFKDPPPEHTMNRNLKNISLAHNDIAAADVKAIVGMILADPSIKGLRVDLHGNKQGEDLIKEMEGKIKGSGNIIVLREPAGTYPQSTTEPAPAKELTRRVMAYLT